MVDFTTFHKKGIDNACRLARLNQIDKYEISQAKFS